MTTSADLLDRAFHAIVTRRVQTGRAPDHSITRELMGIPTPRGGKKWGVSIISLILANSVYAARHPLGVTASAIVSQEIFERAQQFGGAVPQRVGRDVP